ncbi:DivIVA domain-containing protein [Arthrobacter sp. B3I4]|uniref:DivIVA domain-containing protein n=1 Tax=Arthrobacter sp. B3I4 TaxID=3042267 RepID=UPI002789D94F|nr:DivIVA domain-containing protein [Arthrobacter sp. B3I4]MDQ0755652.1 DivIVA domain-containing protein [Arthrobacter sp. B3I4]
MGPVSFFLVFVAIVLAAVAILLGTDLAQRIFRRRAGGRAFEDGFDEPVASLPPVLLPADAEPADLDRIRFAVGVRGYRMDQVDQVLDELRDQIARKDREIAALRAERERPERPDSEQAEPERVERPRRNHPRGERPHRDPAPDPAP